MIYNIDGVLVSIDSDEVKLPELREYVHYIQVRNAGKQLKRVDFVISEDQQFLEATFHFEPQNFERIRRITGYLVGTLDRWNDFKRAEEADRVKHDTALSQMEQI